MVLGNVAISQAFRSSTSKNVRVWSLKSVWFTIRLLISIHHYCEVCKKLIVVVVVGLFQDHVKMSVCMQILAGERDQCGALWAKQESVVKT